MLQHKMAAAAAGRIPFIMNTAAFVHLCLILAIVSLKYMTFVVFLAVDLFFEYLL